MDHQDDTARPKKTLLKQILSFNLVGIVNTAATYALYAGLVALGVDVVIAVTADYALGILLGFWLNRRFTFEAREGKSWTMLAKMVLSYVPLLGLNIAFLYLFVRLWSWNEYGAQIVALVLVTGLSFLAQKFFVFAKRGA